jgi:protein SMG6
VSFSAAQARKLAPKSPGDYTSVSSISSYAHSVVSLNFTLSSGTTDGSSMLSSISDHNKPRDKPKTNAFSNQLKKLYCDISHLEMKLLANLGELQDENCIVIKGGPSAGADEAEKARWKNLIEDHKQYAQPFVFLSDLYHFNLFPQSFRDDAQPARDLPGIWCPHFATKYTREVQHNHLPLD